MSDTIQPDIPATPLAGQPAGNMQNQVPSYTSSSAPADESMPRTLYRKLSESAHPVALLSYLVLQLAPLALYLVGLWFTSNYILFFILIILLLAADFWNVKNISGRLLVGLRWWSETTELGQSVLVFETADPSRHINPIDSKMFWLILYLSPALWVVLGVMAVLKFEFLSLILVIIAVSLTSTNAMAYTKCDKFGKANGIAQNLMGNAASSMFNSMNPLRGMFGRS